MIANKVYGIKDNDKNQLIVSETT